MVNRTRRPAPLGHAGFSPALGARDPRLRTNAHVALSSIDKRQPYGTDEEGRLTVRDILDALDPATATAADIIRVLKDAELMRR